MRSLRVFFIGGMLSYRALFTFLSPGVFVPTLILTPILQILFFAYVGRAAGVQSDTFFVIGNAIQAAAVPCLHAMTFTIADERREQTLSYILISPAARVPLFLGRSFPVILNGAFVAALAFAVGSLLLGVRVRPSTQLLILWITCVATFSCTGLGLITAGLALRARETSVLPNLFVALMLVFCGANVPLDSLPGWMATIGRFLPLTHAIQAARSVVETESMASALGLVQRELLIGAAYTVAGMTLIRYFEWQSRRLATLERS